VYGRSWVTAEKMPIGRETVIVQPNLEAYSNHG